MCARERFASDGRNLPLTGILMHSSMDVRKAHLESLFMLHNIRTPEKKKADVYFGKRAVISRR